MLKLIQKTSVEIKREEKATGKASCPVMCETERLTRRDIWDISSEELANIILEEISDEYDLSQVASKLKELIECWKKGPNNTDLTIEEYIGIRQPEFVALELGLGTQYYHEAMGIIKYMKHEQGLDPDKITRRDLYDALLTLKEIYKKDKVKEI